MYQPWYISEYGQQDIDPEMLAEADFEKHADRRNDNREYYAYEVCHGSSWSDVGRIGNLRR